MIRWSILHPIIGHPTKETNTVRQSLPVTHYNKTSSEAHHRITHHRNAVIDMTESDSPPPAQEIPEPPPPPTTATNDNLRDDDASVPVARAGVLVQAAVPTRDYSKLRRAAASQSPAALREAISSGNWTARDIDDNDAYNHSKGRQKQRQHASKNALHMAAWKGCLDNVRYLVETVGCDIDAYSKQEFSYGKTAIFFALTQSRIDVTEYLLERGAKVTIVNNKGQSVLSMAASHFDCLEPPPNRNGTAPNDKNDDKNENDDDAATRVVRKIRAMEAEQGDWWNFRASHSDGFEYGDQDPRFFEDRPLRETDVVTPLAINPTTKETRKGGFLRRNPEAARRPYNRNCEKKTGGGNRKSTKKQQKQRQRQQHCESRLSQAEQKELERAWEALAPPASSTKAGAEAEPTPNPEETDSAALLTVVRLKDRQRLPWIPETAEELSSRFGTDAAKGLVTTTLRDANATTRQQKLLRKMLAKLRGAGTAAPSSSSSSSSPSSSSPSSSFHQSPNQRSARHRQEAPKRQHFDWNATLGFSSGPRWSMAREVVKDLRLSSFESPGSPVLKLPNPPVFVDAPDGLATLLDRIANRGLVAIDTEWYTKSDDDNSDDKKEEEERANKNDHEGMETATSPRNDRRSMKHRKRSVALATLQISFLAGDDASVESYVVDLKKAETRRSNDSCHTKVDNTTTDSSNNNALPNKDYHVLCQRLVRQLLAADEEENLNDAATATATAAATETATTSTLVLGFAIRHDLPHLEAFLEPDFQRAETRAPRGRSYRHVLDLQPILAATDTARATKSGSNNLPGLKTCASRYSSRPLSKDCQCSDWGRRPLTEAQLEYAGLDAAVLLGLLAERSREEEDGKTA